MQRAGELLSMRIALRLAYEAFCAVNESGSVS
jgi:hypothetical protein